MNTNAKIEFPTFTGLRCLMMPYIQGDPGSVPKEYHAYADIIRDVCVRRGDVGYLTIDESVAETGKPHRGARARFARALHTEAGLHGPGLYGWGSPKPGPGWGSARNVRLDRDVQVLLANNLDDSCALWDAIHEDTSEDGDIGDRAADYPYDAATMMKAGEVHRIGIFTPHESLPVKQTVKRQFLRIVSSGVHGREPYFTVNPLMVDGRTP